MTFDFYSYFKNMTESNKIAFENDFMFSRVSGPMEMQEVVNNITDSRNFIAVTDISDGKYFSAGGGFFTRYIISVFFLSRFVVDDMKDNIEKLNMCRDIRKQFVSAIIRDTNIIDQLRYIVTDEILFREYKNLQIDGLTGTYMILNIDIPTSLCYDANQWK